MGKSLVEHARSKLLYNELSTVYDLAAFHNTKREAAFLNNIVRRYCGKSIKILDLGCGVGRHVELLHRLYDHSVTGIDISRRMVALARRRCPGCSFRRMDIRKIRLAKRFDAAICMWTTFNYLSNKSDLNRFLDGVARVLSPSGIFILDLKNYSKKGAWCCYSRESADKNYRIRLFIEKKIIKRRINEAIYVYFIRDLRNNRKFLALDQELNKIYGLREVRSITRGRFKVLKVFGDYNTDSKYEARRSDRLILVMRNVNDKRR
jgi:SAM-dependent methyltransferase